MTTLSELKNGVRIIHWFTHNQRNPDVHTFQCGQTSLELRSNFGNSQASLTLKEIQASGTAASSTGASKPDSSLPLRVYATYNNQMKEMTETSRGKWAEVSWPFVALDIYDSNGYMRSYGYKYAIFQLTLEFQDTIFAEGERHVLTHLSKLLDTQSMADVTFIIKNEKIGAHAAIVVSGSPVLCAMLEKGNFKEGVTKEVKIEDIDPLVFKEMLRYLYTGRAPNLEDHDMTEPLFLAAHKYQIESLKDLCEKCLITELNLETVIHHLVMAHLYTAPQLLEASLKFLVSRKTEVWPRAEWKELMKTYPELFFLASHRMVG